MATISHSLLAYALAARPRGLATLVRVDGAADRRTPTRVVIGAAGHCYGGLLAGQLAGGAWRRTRQVLQRGRPALLRLDTAKPGAHALGVGLGASGTIEVLIQPFAEGDATPLLDVFRAIAAAERETHVLVTIATSDHPDVALGRVYRFRDEAGFRRIFPLGGRVADRLVEDCQARRASYRSKLLSYATAAGSFDCFVEIIPPVVRLWLFGDNYDVHLLLRLAKDLDWRVGVVADPTTVNRALFRTADSLHDPAGALPPLSERCAVVLMTHDRSRDLADLRRVLATPVPYIGLLGPRRRGDAIRAELTEAERDRLADRLFNPVGLELGATSPAEIGLAVLAEVRALFSGR